MTKPTPLNVALTSNERATLERIARAASLSKTAVIRIALARLSKDLRDDNVYLLPTGEVQNLIDDARQVAEARR